MNDHVDTPVLIVGGGPVGLTLAIALGRRGTRCTLIERKEQPQFLPKMERCNARSMEIFRRLGLADAIRDAGFPRHIPMDVFIVKSMMEAPLLRLPYPSVAEAQAEIAAHNDGTRPLEPYQLVSQYTLEPLLKSVAELLPSVTVKYGWELVSFEQTNESVNVHVSGQDGATKTITSSYLVGCDGGTSDVRKQLGIKLRGEGNLLELRQALFRSPDLFARIPIGKGRHYHVADDRSTMMVVQDDTRHFSLHSVVDADSTMASMFETVTRNAASYEMLSVNKWKQNLLLADRYRLGRVFLAGDAVHLVIPTGGLGMNTGVGDAIDLAWKLSATLEGWGGPALLDSYETERRQIGARNVEASRQASLGRRKWRAAYRPNIWDDSPEGAAVRNSLVHIADTEQRKTNEMIGAELGYRYSDSPIIWPEPGEAPEQNFMHYEPTTWPGARLPHVWLGDGSAVQDRIGSGYTLIHLGPISAPETTLVDEFRKLGAPFAVLEIPEPAAREIYGHDFLLVRPDLHVVWRGNGPPADAERLTRMATGHFSRLS